MGQKEVVIIGQKVVVVIDQKAMVVLIDQQRKISWSFTYFYLDYFAYISIKILMNKQVNNIK